MTRARGWPVRVDLGPPATLTSADKVRHLNWSIMDEEKGKKFGGFFKESAEERARLVKAQLELELGRELDEHEDDFGSAATARRSLGQGRGDENDKSNDDFGGDEGDDEDEEEEGSDEAWDDEFDDDNLDDAEDYDCGADDENAEGLVGPAVGPGELELEEGAVGCSVRDVYLRDLRGAGVLEGRGNGGGGGGSGGDGSGGGGNALVPRGGGRSGGGEVGEVAEAGGGREVGRSWRERLEHKRAAAAMVIAKGERKAANREARLLLNDPDNDLLDHEAAPSAVALQRRRDRAKVAVAGYQGARSLEEEWAYLVRDVYDVVSAREANLGDHGDVAAPTSARGGDAGDGAGREGNGGGGSGGSGDGGGGGAMDNAALGSWPRRLDRTVLEKLRQERDHLANLRLKPFVEDQLEAETEAAAADVVEARAQAAAGGSDGALPPLDPADYNDDLGEGFGDGFGGGFGAGTGGSEGREKGVKDAALPVVPASLRWAKKRGGGLALRADPAHPLARTGGSVAGGQVAPGTSAAGLVPGGGGGGGGGLGGTLALSVAGGAEVESLTPFITTEEALAFDWVSTARCFC